MGIIWKSAMPLLSTLAALVIIVHSAEEDNQSDYRRDLRPRVVDSGIHSYEQPWRLVDNEHILYKQSTETNTWNNNSTEESQKPRRGGRKRKRRPQTSLIDSIAPQETNNYPDEPLRPNIQVDLTNTAQSAETPKRRRKKLETKSVPWTDVPLHRPFKRRGQRRKRPSLKIWPDLSEFNGYHNKENTQTTIGSSEQKELTDINQHDDSKQYITNIGNANNDGQLLEDILPREPENSGKDESKEQFRLFTTEKDSHTMQHRGPYLQEDKSLSEFSFEVMHHGDEPKSNDDNENLRGKLEDKSTGLVSEYDKAQDKILLHHFDDESIINDFIWLLRHHNFNLDMSYKTLKSNLVRIKAKEKIQISNKLNTEIEGMNNTLIVKPKSKDGVQERDTELLHEYMIDGPVDPITLKDILKRSNGTSLSEILQLHNLSLADLLNGKENAISILKSKGSYESKQSVPNNIASNVPISKFGTENHKQLFENGNEENVLLHLETKYVTVPVAEIATTTQSIQRVETEKDYKKDDVKATLKQENNTNKIINIRRYPIGTRRKLRMRPMINSTYKSPLSRDLIALNARKYLNQRRNASKSIELKNVIPSVTNISTPDGEIDKLFEISTVPITTDEHLTTQSDVDNKTQSLLFKNDDNNNSVDVKEGSDTIFSTTSVKPDRTSENLVLVNEPPLIVSTIKPVLITPQWQRHSFNNGMKKKRRRQKMSTTELPKTETIFNPLEKENLTLSTEITMRPQEPKLKEEDQDFFTALEDFMTTQLPSISETILKSVKHSSVSPTTFRPRTTTYRISEKTAKIEIDEIFKDIQTSARLSKILMERNMTLTELVEHRERGSSHVHLADIFHNASKEPNPPEPFLSKSVIEPISKETYPLRAILEANAHDATIKPMINDPSILEANHINIPIVMDFGNNVNENAENMGIMSLFKNFTKTLNHNNTSEKDFEVRLHGTDLTAMNTTDKKAMPTVRQNRVLIDNTNQDDVVSWNEIFSLMRRNYKNETKDLFQSIQNESSLSETPSTISVEDVDADGLIVFEDLQHLKSFDNNVSPDSNERLHMNSLERTNAATGIFEKIPSQTKSITVATASIAGLAIVLFLLTYALFKWKRHKVVCNKEHSFSNERIPTPVFENRKGQKHNSSTRSISPMLSTSNIYTLNTLDSRNGKDSPEYMWDTLRKPFQ